MDSHLSTWKFCRTWQVGSIVTVGHVQSTQAIGLQGLRGQRLSIYRCFQGGAELALPTSIGSDAKDVWTPVSVKTAQVRTRASVPDMKLSLRNAHDRAR